MNTTKQSGDGTQEFKITYGNDDGYAGGSRPHHVSIDAFELEEDMGDDEIKLLFWDSIRDHFENHHTNLHSTQEEEFLTWAKERIEALKEESE